MSKWKQSASFLGSGTNGVSFSGEMRRSEMWKMISAQHLETLAVWWHRSRHLHFKKWDSQPLCVPGFFPLWIWSAAAVWRVRLIMGVCPADQLAQCQENLVELELRPRSESWLTALPDRAIFRWCKLTLATYTTPWPREQWIPGLWNQVLNCSFYIILSPTGRGE